MIVVWNFPILDLWHWSFLYKYTLFVFERSAIDAYELKIECKRQLARQFTWSYSVTLWPLSVSSHTTSNNGCLYERIICTPRPIDQWGLLCSNHTLLTPHLTNNDGAAPYWPIRTTLYSTADIQWRTGCTIIKTSPHRTGTTAKVFATHYQNTRVNAPHDKYSRWVRAKNRVRTSARQTVQRWHHAMTVLLLQILCYR